MFTNQAIHTLAKLVAISLIGIGFFLQLAPAHAFEKLTEAQSWIYDRGHLANTTQGQILSYHYTAQDATEQNVDDEASVAIMGEHDDGRRDVEIDFLSEHRHLPLPVFNGYRGNPVIIAMLEHIAQSVSAESGGGALYVRNRIRDALASEKVMVETQQLRYNDRDVVATRITFHPFTDDVHLSGDQLIRQSKFNIDLSDDVPGGVLQVKVTARHEEQIFERTLSLI